jgi:uncharacterized membrane protein
MTTTNASNLSLGRRVDNMVLRLQGRLESPFGDRMVPSLVAVILFGVLAATALAQASGPTAGGLLAPTLQAVWLIGSGADPVVTVNGGSTVLAQEFALLIYPVAWMTRWLPTVITLVVIQAAALAAGVVPVWQLARRAASLRIGASTVLVVVYALYPAVHGVNLAGFHTEAFALPALLWAAYFGLMGRRGWFWLASAVVLASRSDLGLAVAGLGVALWLVGRPGIGRQAIVGGVVWSAVTALLIQPFIGDGATNIAYATFGDSSWSVVTGLVTQPGDVLAAVVQESTMTTFVVLFGPVLFLPLLAPRLLIGVLPIQLLYLVADTPDQALLAQDAVPMTAFVFLSTAFALARLGRKGLERVTVDPRLLVALLVAGLVFYVTDSPSSPYEQPWTWGPTAAVETRRAVFAELPPDVAVRASASVLDVLAERPRLYRLEMGERPNAVDVTDGVDLVVVDKAQFDSWDTVRRRVFADAMTALGFDQPTSRRDRVSSLTGVLVWQRQP